MKFGFVLGCRMVQGSEASSNAEVENIHLQGIVLN